MRKSIFYPVIISLLFLCYSAFFWKAGWLVGAVFTLIPGAVLILLLIINFFLLFHKRRTFFKYIISSLLSIAVGISAGLYMSGAEEKEITKRGEIIVNSLQLYKKDRGCYPENMRDLVPDYLPEHFSFDKIGYKRLSDGSFIVSAMTANCGKTFRSDENNWRYRPCP